MSLAVFSFAIPVKTLNTSNQREHWAPKAKRAAKERLVTRAACPRWNLGPAVVVRMTRFSRGTLDDDGLRSALKSVRDGIASWLRIDDGSPLVAWDYHQEKGEPRIEVGVWRVPD